MKKMYDRMAGSQSLLVSLGWTMCLLVLFFWMMERTWTQKMQGVQKQLQTSLEKDLEYHDWNARVGGIYLIKGNGPRRAVLPFVADTPQQKNTPESLIFVEPEEMTRLLQESAGENRYIRRFNPDSNAIDPALKPDRWEKIALNTFARESVHRVSQVVKLDGEQYMRMMLPIYSEPAYEQFHRSLGYEEGGLWGGVSMTLPLDDQITAYRSLRANFGGSLFLIWVVGLIGISVSFRQSRKRIAGQKNLLGALTESEQRYRSLIEQSNDGIYLLYRDRFELVNSRFTEMFGYTLEETNSPAFNFRKLVAPQSLPRIEERMERLARGEKLSPIYEFTALTKSGEEIECETSVSYIAYKGGSATQGIIRDVSERKQREDQLNRLAAVIQQATESIIITDLQANILYVNPAFEKITGYSREEVTGKNPRILKSENHDSIFYKQMWETLTAGKAWSGIFINKKKDGTLFHEDATIFPVLDSEGKIINYAAVKRDMTREQTLADQLHQAQKMESVGRLAGGVAHDFNNLLTVINGYCELLLNRLQPGEDMYREIDMIAQSGHRAERLTSQLLAFSRKQIQQPEILNMNNAIRDLIRMLKRLIGEDIGLETVFDNSLLNIKADPGQIEQILLNLVVNARDAMPEGGKLTIETENVRVDEEYASRHISAKAGQYVRLSVSDSGIGMDKETRSKIFEPFYTTKESGKGTGLGLSTVYGIVKQSGGFIWVYSEPGQGSSFKIYLPAVRGRSDRKKASLPDKQELFGNEMVLVVEDDQQVRAIAAEILSRHGYTVLQAATGHEALHLLKEEDRPVHLLITDVIMPEMSGKELAAQVEKRHPEVKTIYMSGYTDNAITHHGILKPGLFFLQKPFTPASLLRQVRQSLDKPD